MWCFWAEHEILCCGRMVISQPTVALAQDGFVNSAEEGQRVGTMIFGCTVDRLVYVLLGGA